MDSETDTSSKRQPRLIRRQPELPRNWQVRLPDGTLKGTYHESHIQDLLYYDNLPLDCEVAAVGTEDWYLLPEHPKAEILVPAKKRIDLRREATFKATEDKSDPVDVREILQENVRLHEEAVWQRDRSTGRLRRSLDLLLGGMICILLFAGVGVGAAWFFVENPAQNHYLLGGLAGAVVGFFYARSRSGSLTQWR